MVALQVCLPTLANPKANPCPIRGTQQNHHQPPRKLPSTNYSPKLEQPLMLFPPANQSVAAIVFGDGSGSQLYPLTKRRSEGAIPIAGSYRLIDAVVSNCINSNINKIYALTQFNSNSLNSHLTRAYNGLGLGKEGFVEVIAAYQSPEDGDWFRGTADAIRRCLWVLEEYPVLELLVLPGHHLYKMDYQKLIKAHRSKHADITCAVLTSARNHDSEFGMFKINLNDKVVKFSENRERRTLKSVSVKKPVEINGANHDVFPGMGIYVINREVMIKLLRENLPKANDLKGEVIPGAISLGMKVYAYRFDGYWEDMRSIEAFYHANLECTKRTNIPYNFYDHDFPMYTLPRHLPPSTITNAVITDSVIGDGCILNRCNIRNTVVGARTRVGDGALIEDSILMGADFYQMPDVLTCSSNSKGNGIPVGIGDGSHIRKAIVDKNARIGKNVMIINRDNVQEADMETYGYTITAGIVVILRSAVIPDESIL